MGFDFTPTAIRKARDKAKERNIKATFLTRNVLDLQNFGRAFDVVIDSGFFHVLTDEERPIFVTSLSRILRDHGTYFMLCFSELEPAPTGLGGLSKTRSGTHSVTSGTSITFDRRRWKVDE